MARWFRWGIGGMVAGFIGGYLWAQRQHRTQTTVDLATFRRQWTEEMQWQQRDDFRQYQALLTLRDQLPLRAPLPPMRGYAISPDFAVALLTLIQELKPKRVLELGCGVSTLVVAYALEQQNAGGRVVSLEHYAEFAERTRATLRLHQLEKTAQVLDAPLKELTVPNWQSQWYDIALLADDEPFDLLIVDGPPQYNNPHPMARYPALPMLIKHLTPNATIVLDDANRTNEQLAAWHWVREYPLDILPAPEAEKGVLILKRR